MIVMSVDTFATVIKDKGSARHTVPNKLSKIKVYNCELIELLKYFLTKFLPTCRLPFA